MECSEALDLLYASFDGQITPTQQALLNGHRRTCFACSNSLVKAERFQELLRHVPQLTVPRGLEQRIINRVDAHRHASGAPSAHGASLASALSSLSSMLFGQRRPLSVMAGAMAAAAAVLFIVHGVALQNVGPHPNDETVTAFVQGTVQRITAGNNANEVAQASAPLTSGDVLRNTNAKAATVAIGSHLAMTMSAFSQIHFNRLHLDPQTGRPDIIDVHLDRGSMRVHEVLHREVSPIHVATNQATMVPTGTTFDVTSTERSTRLFVAAGSVAVYMPGRVLNVIAGQGARIGAHGFVRENPARHGVRGLQPGPAARSARPPKR